MRLCAKRSVSLAYFFIVELCHFGELENKIKIALDGSAVNPRALREQEVEVVKLHFPADNAMISLRKSTLNKI